MGFVGTIHSVTAKCALCARDCECVHAFVCKGGGRQEFLYTNLTFPLLVYVYK